MTDSNIEAKKDNSTLDPAKKEQKEIGGPKGLEPTRYGKTTPEWEVKGRVSDF